MIDIDPTNQNQGFDAWQAGKTEDAHSCIMQEDMFLRGASRPKTYRSRRKRKHRLVFILL